MTDQDVTGLTPELDADPFPAFSQTRRRGVRVTTAAAVALALALSGGAVAGASSTTPGSTSTSSSGTPGWGARPPGGGCPPVAVGTVKTVGDDTFTLTDQSGTTVTVDVSSSTTYRDPGVTSPTIANVTVGEHVAVFGTERSALVNATSVAIGDPPAGGKGGPGGSGHTGGPPGAGGSPPVAVGTVKTVGDDTFTLTDQSGTTVTVDVSSSTTYRDPGVTSPTIADVTVGEHVAVFGTESSAVVTATSVGIGGPPTGGPSWPGGPGGPGGSGRKGGTPPTTSSGTSS